MPDYVAVIHLLEMLVSAAKMSRIIQARLLLRDGCFFIYEGAGVIPNSVMVWKFSATQRDNGLTSTEWHELALRVMELVEENNLCLEKSKP